MEFELTQEQHALQSAVRTFVQRSCPPEKAKYWDENDVYPDDVFSMMAELGWVGLAYPEDVGGGGGGALELAIIAEELGRSSLDMSACYTASLIAGLTVSSFADEAQRERIIPDILSGKARLAVSISEPDAGSDVKQIATRATDLGGYFMLNGQKMWCTGAGLPRTLLAMYVRTSGKRGDRHGISLLIVDPNTEGIELRRIPTLARHIMGTYEVFLTDVQVPKSSLIGEVDEGWSVLLHGLELERVLISGGYVGAAQATVDEAVEYAKGRRQFGRAIGDFQAIAHMLADLQTEVDAARLLVQRAAWRVARGMPARQEGSMAKLAGSEVYVKAARAGMQVMGGYGFSTESLMSYRYRESIVATISGGTSQIQRNGIARSMGLLNQ